jgi:hypothetical protein
MSLHPTNMVELLSRYQILEVIIPGNLNRM